MAAMAIMASMKFLPWSYPSDSQPARVLRNEQLGGQMGGTITFNVFKSALIPKKA